MTIRTTAGALALLIVLVGSAPAEVLFRTEQQELPAADLPVSLDADETPLTAALSLLALQVGVNVVVAPGVEGTISIHLASVPFREALTALTSGRDIAYYTAGDVVVIVPRTEGNTAGMSTLAFRLRHLHPESILEAAKAMMSPEGQAVPLVTQPADAFAASDEGNGQQGAQPVIIFRDYPAHLVQLESALIQLDVPQQQVLIEVKFIEARSEDLKNIGVEWPAGVSTGITSAVIDGGGTGTSTTDETESSERRYSYGNDLNSGQYRWGIFGVSEVVAFVNWLVENGSGRILSQPRVSVMDNEKAEIHITTTNPVETINRLSEGAVIQDVVTYQYIETGIKLEVRPRVSDDGYIALDVHPIFEEILGFVGPASSPAPVTAKRSIETTIKVRTGETVILGGLIKEREIETTSKVWLLGDIPILGALFRNKRTELEQGELMILITPTLLNQN